MYLNLRIPLISSDCISGMGKSSGGGGRERSVLIAEFRAMRDILSYWLKYLRKLIKFYGISHIDNTMRFGGMDAHASIYEEKNDD
jgi:hypothetical protein